MADLFLAQVIKNIGILCADLTKQALSPVDETRKHSYFIFGYLKRLDVELDRIDKALKVVWLSKKDRKKLQEWQGYDNPLRIIQTTCGIIAGLLNSLESSVGKVESKFEIYGDPDFIEKMREWYLGDGIFMFDILNTNTEARLKISSDEWTRSIDKLRKELTVLRSMLSKFIRENYKLAERADGR
jgi:hypothetical protein